MKDFVLITDANSDLGADMLKELDIHVIPMEATIGELTFMYYPDYRELPIEEFYKRLHEGQSVSTALINFQNYVDVFEPFLRQGKDILYLAFSSALSASYEKSELAAQTLREKYPESSVTVYDTRKASTGQGLLVYRAALARKEGKSLEETLELVKGLAPNCMAWFTLDDLHHLKRGGRLPASVAIAGTLLGVKPVLTLDSEGRLQQVDKARGRQRALEYLADKLRATIDDSFGQTVFISHAACLEDAERLEELIRRGAANIREVFINYIGPPIGAHAGPGTIALFFIKKPES